MRQVQEDVPSLVRGAHRGMPLLQHPFQGLPAAETGPSRDMSQMRKSDEREHMLLRHRDTRCGRVVRMQMRGKGIEGGKHVPQVREDVQNRDVLRQETVYTERMMVVRWSSNRRGAGADT